jgi:dimethylargininase
VDHRGIALVRTPSRRLAEGIVTHIKRMPVDLDLALRQHDAYIAALTRASWDVHAVTPADDCPDSVFVEDTVVVCDRLAVLTRPGAPQRRAEIAGTAQAVRAAGLDTVEIEDPATLDGGDVLQVGSTVYIGQGGRTNADGIRQLAAHLRPLGRTVVPVSLGKVLHLKSAVTALPDGTVLARPDLVETSPFLERASAVREVEEEAGAHVVPLGEGQVLIAASAPKTAKLLDDLGFTPVVVDISEFEKLEGCVTCLNVLIAY